MKLRITDCELHNEADSAERFEAVSERRATVLGPPAFGRQALPRSALECRRGELKSGAYCARCPHFLNAVPAEDGRSVLVRCIYLENDPVDLLMTCAENIVSIPEDETLGAAALRMLDNQVQQLVVTERGEAVGLLGACAIERLPPDDRVNRHVERPVPVVARSMTLGAAAKMFVDHQLDRVLVIEHDEVVGLLTRGDLRRAGVPGV